MKSKLTINIFEQAVERFTATETEVLKNWRLPCNCPAPGERSNCQNCPYFRELDNAFKKTCIQIPLKFFR